MTDEVNRAQAGAVIALMRATRSAALATVEGGQPFASLVTPAAAPDRSMLLLLSGLSPHTRHLRAAPACSLLLTGPATSANPQTSPRATLLGTAAPEPDPAAKARWLALHPYAGFYADLPDFQVWRVRVTAAQYVGGFASAGRLDAAALTPDADAVAAIAAAEARVIEHCNDDHADAMDLIARAHAGDGEGWRMVACDVDGCDLRREETVLRVPWSAPVTGSGGIRAELVRLTGAARSAAGSGSGAA